MALKIDLHVHTYFSHDGFSTPSQVVVCSKQRGLDGVAVTDHDTLDGALQLFRSRELLVIPGIEIGTLQGHVLALNVTKSVASKLSISETIRRIHEAGGIAVAAHPLAIGKMGASQQLIKTLNFDAVEVINSTAFPFSISTYLNRKLASQIGLPQTAGSDSHIPQTIGMAYTLIDADPDVDGIIRAIKRGATIPRGRSIPWTMRLRKSALTLKKSIF